MTRSADEFFARKRPWSKYKDLILDYYLRPYLTKVLKIGKPIAVVDMFAGAGSFDSGEEGSPLIIAKRLQEFEQSPVCMRLITIEANESNADRLQKAVQPFRFAEVWHADCMERVEQIASIADTHTTFLYIDPYEVSQLHLDRLGTVYDRIFRLQSVEVLLVFMAQAFVRQGLQLLKAERKIRNLSECDSLLQSFEGTDQIEWAYAIGSKADIPSINVLTVRRELNLIAGGDYWEEILIDPAISYKDKVDKLADAYSSMLHKWFQLIMRFPIRASVGWDVPKYWMIFGSRYLPAAELFNDASCRARRNQQIEYAMEPNSLFQSVYLDTRADPNQVDASVRRACHKPMTWENLLHKICVEETGRFLVSEVNQSIKRLLQSGSLTGSDGKKIDLVAVLSRHPDR